VVLAREMFDAGSDDLVEALEACVRPVAPDARLEKLGMPAVVGSALMALDLAGHAPAPTARSSLADGIASVFTTRATE